MADAEKATLSRDDLFLLLESYRNTIELNSTLAEKQNQLIDLNKHLMSKSMELCTKIEKVAEKLDMCADEMKKTCVTWHDEQVVLKSTATLERTEIKNKINLVYVGFGACVLPLIGLAYQAFEFHKLLEHIMKLVGAP